MSLIARAPFVRQQLLRSRLAAPSRGAHADYKHIPFATVDATQSKGVFGAKVVVYFLSGFLLPVVAAGYQLRKSGSGA